MDLRQLRYFIALTEYRSFVRAAEAMGITQPAFSRAIQGLEHTFGCPLVDRASKALLPTPEGLVVLQHARRLVQGAAQLSNEVLQMTKLDAGELHFGSGPALAVPMASLACTTLRSIARCSVCRCGMKSLRPLRLARRLRTPGASRALASG